MPSRAVPAEALARFLASPTPEGSLRRGQGPDYYQWLIGAGPAGDAVSWCAVHGERVVGSLTAVLRDMHVCGETVLAAKLEEMRTDPEHRGQGILRKVWECVKDEALARGARLVIGGPTSPMSLPIYLERLGFVAPFPIRAWLRPLALPGFAGRAGVCEEERLPEDAVALAERASAGAEIAVVRSEAYLRWRYEAHPDRYRFFTLRSARRARALAVTKHTRQRGQRLVNVTELWEAEAGAAFALLAGLAATLLREDAGGWLVLWPPRAGGRGAFLRRGFVPYPPPTRIVLWSEPRLAERAGAHLARRAAWSLGMGDFLDL